MQYRGIKMSELLTGGGSNADSAPSYDYNVTPDINKYPFKHIRKKLNSNSQIAGRYNKAVSDLVMDTVRGRVVHAENHSLTTGGSGGQPRAFNAALQCYTVSSTLVQSKGTRVSFSDGTDESQARCININTGSKLVRVTAYTNLTNAHLVITQNSFSYNSNSWSRTASPGHYSIVDYSLGKSGTTDTLPSLIHETAKQSYRALNPSWRINPANTNQIILCAIAGETAKDSGTPSHAVRIVWDWTTMTRVSFHSFPLWTADYHLSDYQSFPDTDRWPLYTDSALNLYHGGRYLGNFLTSESTFKYLRDRGIHPSFEEDHDKVVDLVENTIYTGEILCSIRDRSHAS